MKLLSFVFAAGVSCGLTSDLAAAFNASRYKLGLQSMYPSYELESALSGCFEATFSDGKSLHPSYVGACRFMVGLECWEDNSVFGFPYTRVERFFRLCNYSSSEAVIDFVENSWRGKAVIFSEVPPECWPVNTVAGVKRGNDIYVLFSYTHTNEPGSINPVYLPYGNCSVAGMEEYLVPSEDSELLDLYTAINARRTNAKLPVFKYSSEITRLSKSFYVGTSDLLCSTRPHVSCRKPDASGCSAYEMLRILYFTTDAEKIAKEFMEKKDLPYALNETYSPNQWLAIGFLKGKNWVEMWVAYGVRCQKMCVPKPPSLTY